MKNVGFAVENKMKWKSQFSQIWKEQIFSNLFIWNVGWCCRERRSYIFPSVSVSLKTHSLSLSHTHSLSLSHTHTLSLFHTHTSILPFIAISHIHNLRVWCIDDTFFIPFDNFTFFKSLFSQLVIRYTNYSFHLLTVVYFWFVTYIIWQHGIFISASVYFDFSVTITKVVSEKKILCKSWLTFRFLMHWQVI